MMIATTDREDYRLFVALASEALVPEDKNHNLPVGLTSFLGREDELARVTTLLSRHRLVTICGPGGSGKTRLAIEIAHDLVPKFQHGAWLIELAHIDDPELIPTTAASSLGVREHPGRSMTESLAAVIAGRHLLLLVDNCEHLITGAAEFCDSLLRAAVDLRILATSREPLGVAGEVRYPLPPLPVPSVEDVPRDLHDFDSVVLFAERAAESDPNFELTSSTAPSVATIVQSLDGMPLAIELAAAQLDALSLDDLTRGLPDRFRVLVNPVRATSPRHASLAATVEWSYRLLDENEKRAFRRLSIFPAPFTLEAAVAAIGEDAGLLVARLVRRSLIMAPRVGADGRSRYRMLETLRAYGAERLTESGERDQVARALATWTVGEAERMATIFATPDDGPAGRWGDAEQDNLREILKWALINDRPSGLRLAIALCPWWFLRGRYRDATSALEHGLTSSPPTGSEMDATAVVWLGRMALYSADYAAALSHFRRADELLANCGLSALRVDRLADEAMAHINLGRVEDGLERAALALEMARSLQYKAGEAYACAVQAHTGLCSGDFVSAVAWAEKSSAVDNREVSGVTSRWCTIFLVWALFASGDLRKSEFVLQETLDRCRAAGDRYPEATLLENLARNELLTGRYEGARSHVVEAMRIGTEIGDPLRICDCLSTAAVWAAPHRPEDAAVLWGASRSLLDFLGLHRHRITEIVDASDSNSACDSVFYTDPILALRDTLGPELSDQADERGAAMPFDEALAFAMTVLTEERATANFSARPKDRLSKRERELIGLLAEGLTDKQIGEKLFISLRTVRSHLDRIRAKTGARRRAELARLA